MASYDSKPDHLTIGYVLTILKADAYCIFLRTGKIGDILIVFVFNFQKQSLVGGLAAVAMLGGLIGAGNIQGVVRFVQVSLNSTKRNRLHIT